MTIKNEITKLFDGVYDEEKINFRNYTIKIQIDKDAPNPLDDLDIMPPLITGREDCFTMANYSNDYRVTEFFKNVSRGWMKYHKKAICDILEIDHKTHIDDIPKELENINKYYYWHDLWDILEKLYTLAKIPFIYGTIDYDPNQTYLMVATDEYLKETGITKKNAIESMQVNIKLYENWLDGNCYYYTIYNCAVSFDDPIGACGGFYGDHEESGIIDAIIDDINCDMEHRRNLHTSKLKQLIKHRVPLEARPRLLSGY